MYRRNRRHKKFSNLALAILCIVAIITLGTLLYINDKQEKEQQIKYEQIAREEREKQKKIEDQSNITLSGLRLGTFQLSDLFYNTVGGVLGGLMYYTVMKVRKHL